MQTYMHKDVTPTLITSQLYNCHILYMGLSLRPPRSYNSAQMLQHMQFFAPESLFMLNSLLCDSNFYLDVIQNIGSDL